MSKYMEAYFRAGVLNPLSQNVRCSQPRFQRAKGVLESVTTDAHYIRRLNQSRHYRLHYIVVFSAFDAPIDTRGELRLH